MSKEKKLRLKWKQDESGRMVARWKLKRKKSKAKKSA